MNNPVFDSSGKKTTLGGTILGSILVVSIALLIFPESIPFPLFEFWFFRGPIEEILISMIPLICVGLLLSVAKLYHSKNDIILTSHVAADEDTASLLGASAFLSGIAGVFEELIFRWLIFYGVMVTSQLVNWLFFGFLGFGIPEWFYVTIVGPLANFATFQALQPYLLGGLWFVGAAIVSSNGKFRDSHTKHKLIGLIFVWYAGIYFFWVMFHYGLFASMLVHFLYDFIVISIGLLYARRVSKRYTQLRYFFPRRRTF